MGPHTRWGYPELWKRIGLLVRFRRAPWLVAMAVCFLALSVPAAVQATNANFCALYWTKFDTRCWYRINPVHGTFERGINYTRNYDMWIFAYDPSGAGVVSAHAGPHTYKACLYFSSQVYANWAIMPYYPTNATIARHVDNYGVNETC
jgi:hypothetical protein